MSGGEHYKRHGKATASPGGEGKMVSWATAPASVLPALDTLVGPATVARMTHSDCTVPALCASISYLASNDVYGFTLPLRSVAYPSIVRSAHQRFSSKNRRWMDRAFHEMRQRSNPRSSSSTQRHRSTRPHEGKMIAGGNVQSAQQLMPRHACGAGQRATFQSRAHEWSSGDILSPAHAELARARRQRR
jgi:hypothetical protein